MERIVGLGLARYLSTYIKNFSAQNFQNWALNDLGRFSFVSESFPSVCKKYESFGHRYHSLTLLSMLRIQGRSCSRISRNSSKFTSEESNL
jgi:hypothetical protein